MTRPARDERWPERWAAALHTAFADDWLAAGRALLTQARGLSLETSAEGSDLPGLRARLVLPAETRSLQLSLWPLPSAAVARALVRSTPAAGAEIDPRRLAAALVDAGQPLLPESAEDLVADCDCAGAPACAHTAASLVALGTRLDDRPELLLALRGIRLPAPAPGAGEAPRAGASSPDRRSEPGARPRRSAPAPSPGDEALENLLSEFWAAGRALDSFETSARAPELPLLVLRLLGPAPFLDAAPDRLLGPDYETISRRALELAEGEAPTRAGQPPAEGRDGHAGRTKAPRGTRGLLDRGRLPDR